MEADTRVAFYGLVGYLVFYFSMLQLNGPSVDPTLSSLVGALAGIGIGTFAEEAIMRRNRKD